jgi:type VI protein secretion system component Hcp
MRLSAFLILTKDAPPDAPGPGDALPKSIPSLKGLSSDEKFAGSFEIASYSYRFNHHVGSDGTVGQTVPDYLYVIKPVDRASPFLFETARKNKIAQLEKVKGAILCVCRPGTKAKLDSPATGLEVFWRIHVKNPWITSIAQVGDPLLHPIERSTQTHLAVPTYGPLEEVSFWGDEVRFFYEPDAEAKTRSQSVAIPVPPPLPPPQAPPRSSSLPHPPPPRL